MDYNFKHFLVIDSEEIEILEPINFDSSSFIVEQDKKKYGRDVYKGNEEISLYFGDEIGEPLEIERVLNNGMILRHKNSGLELLLNANNNYGTEAIVFWKLQFGTESILFELDFGTAKTDNLTYIELKVIQNTEQAKIKRREKIKVDAFATKDLDGNDITPITTHKMLLKAKPIVQISEWQFSNQKWAQGGANNYYYAGISRFFFLNRLLTKYDIQNSYTPFDSQAQTPTLRNDRLVIIEATTDLSNIKIKLTNLKLIYNHVVNNNPDTFGNGIRTDFSIACGVLKFGATSLTGIVDVFPNIVHTEPYNITTIINEPLLEVELPVSITNGDKIVFYYDFGFTQRTSDVDYLDLSRNSHLILESSNLQITATSTAISSVINSVRYIDLIKQNYKAIGATAIIAPKFDVGSQFYNNFCFNGKLIRQLADPFYLELTDTLESLQEFNADSQINESNNFIGQYNDFYPNIDLGGFLINPDKEFSIEKNERYLINKFTFGYKKYQKDNTEKDNTLDAIHTDTEWYVPNNKSENEKKVDLPFSRDHFLAEYLRRRVTNNTTADVDDDTIFIFDVIELAPNSREEFTAVLKFQKSDADNTFKLLANENFSWDLLGFQLGNQIFVNSIPYNAIEITPSLLTLSYGGGDASGEEVFTINYPLTGVQYTIRTNEGLTYSENLLNPNVYGNLRYSIKRNIKYWNNYLATAGKFIPTKEISNSYFKANGNAITKFAGETENIKENESIIISEITDNKILSQNIINTTVTASFERVKELLEKLQTINTDNSIGGFIRVQDQNGRILKGYIQKLENTWKYEELTLELEEKNESDFLNIVFSGGIFTINEVGYSTKTFTESRYNIFNEFIQFFDENNINLCNRTKYDKIRLNGIIYNSSDELAIAIDSL